MRVHNKLEIAEWQLPGHQEPGPLWKKKSNTGNTPHLLNLEAGDTLCRQLFSVDYTML